MSTGDYHHGDLRNALLRAVRETIAERGVGEVSLREVARRAGVSHSAPAHHFGDKQGMLTAFATEGFVIFGEALSTAAKDAGDDPIDRISAVGLAYIRFALDQAHHFDVMFRSEFKRTEDEALNAACDAAYAVLVEESERLSQADYFSGFKVEYVAAGLWAHVHGLASLWLDGPLPEFFEDRSLEELAEQILPMIVVAATPR